MRLFQNRQKGKIDNAYLLMSCWNDGLGDDGHHGEGSDRRVEDNAEDIGLGNSYYLDNIGCLGNVDCQGSIDCWGESHC